ncbi:hypothetical protein ACFY00_32925 [Kitasatospora sp. NPDC001540]|uniref:hypothetical protein n=1 Tax=Kitasatospora sp. NPDC001540 TaxID=3364014 RepID=UPI0036B6929F
MATRTHVTIHAVSGVSEDTAREAAEGLVRGRPVGPIEVWRSSGKDDPKPGDPKIFFVSLEGNVENEVRAQLSSSIDLPFTIEVMKNM